MTAVRGVALLALVGAGVGIAAEVHTGAGPLRTAADLATGWTLLACGALGMLRRPAQRRWALLVLAGMTWFAGNFAGALAYLHRGPLVHCAVSATRERSALAIVTVLAGYAAAVTTGTASGWTALTAAALLAALAVRSLRHGAAVTGMPIAVVSALGVAASTALLDVSQRYVDGALYAYEGLLCLAALLLLGTTMRGSVADLVVELGPAHRSPGVRAALAAALGDPTLSVGYWLDGRYVDLEGRVLELPADGSGRAATIVAHDGERIAALVHDAALLDDRQLAQGVRQAAGLILANERLEGEAGARMLEVRASRQRIVAARDAQRRRLARRLHDGAEQRLARVATAVEQLRARGETTPEQAELLELLEGELVQARAELHELGRGIHPRALTERGLAAALDGLAARSPVPVALKVPDTRLPEAVEAAAYFLCAEALTNVVKYARASSARCHVRVDGARVLVTVADDGAGGADPARGTGLRGLVDRVEALDGRLRVTSAPGQGTVIDAELPLIPSTP